MKLTLPPIKPALPPIKLALPPIKLALRRIRHALPPIKLTPIAAAALIPSTLVGIACSVAVPLSGGAPPAALAANVSARPAVHAVSHPRTPAKHPAPATAPAAQPSAPAAQPAPPAPAPSQPAGSGQAATGTSATSSQPLTAGMSPYEQCVAWRESGDNPTASSAGLFGILPYIWQSLGYSGTAGQASVAQQEAAFNQLYAQYGTQPWSPSDGC